jgi:hypothetical protein
MTALASVEVESVRARRVSASLMLPRSQALALSVSTSCLKYHRVMCEHSHILQCGIEVKIPHASI